MISELHQRVTPCHVTCARPEVTATDEAEPDGSSKCVMMIYDVWTCGERESGWGMSTPLGRTACRQR